MLILSFRSLRTCGAPARTAAATDANSSRPRDSCQSSRGHRRAESAVQWAASASGRTRRPSRRT